MTEREIQVAIGDRFKAVNPGAWYQVADRHTPSTPKDGSNYMPATEAYWMDIVGLTDDTFTYDSFIIRGGFIDPITKGRTVALSKLLAEVKLGTLIQEKNACCNQQSTSSSPQTKTPCG